MDEDNQDGFWRRFAPLFYYVGAAISFGFAGLSVPSSAELDRRPPDLPSPWIAPVALAALGVAFAVTGYGARGKGNKKSIRLTSPATWSGKLAGFGGVLGFLNGGFSAIRKHDIRVIDNLPDIAGDTLAGILVGMAIGWVIGKAIDIWFGKRRI